MATQWALCQSKGNTLNTPLANNRCDKIYIDL